MAICDRAFGYQQKVMACSPARQQQPLGNAFVRENHIKTLNVAGSRASKETGAASFVKAALEEAFGPRIRG
jgi:hypothetical protein